MITSSKLKLYGVGGTNGAGKDTVADMLADYFGFLFVSGSDMLREEAKRRGQPIEREVLRTISAEWRRESGLGVIIDKAVEMFNAEPGKWKGLVVSSIRNHGEADRIHELGGQLIWVDADSKVRFDRIFSRQRSDEDKKTFEDFLKEEQAEMQHSGDEATLNTAIVKERADIFLTNDSSDVEAFKMEAANKLDLAS